MPDDTREITTPENETQESATPTEEQKTTNEPVETAQVPDQESKVEPESKETNERVVKHNREYIEKLQTQLREERQAREHLEGAFKTLQPKKPEGPKLSPIYDPNTGLLNEQALTERDRLTYEAVERSQRAEQALQDYQLRQQEQETFQAHPDLNPDSKTFDKTLNKRVKEILYTSSLFPQDYGGQMLSFKEAADVAKQEFTNTKAIESAKKEGAKLAMENLTPKEQASLEATGMPDRRQEVNDDLDTLRRKSRGTGETAVDAIVARMKKAGV